jgi:hypothetical protein
MREFCRPKPTSSQWRECVFLKVMMDALWQKEVGRMLERSKHNFSEELTN